MIHGVSIVAYGTRHCTTLYCIVLYCSVLDCKIQHCTVFNCRAQLCTKFNYLRAVLKCLELHGTALPYISHHTTSTAFSLNT
jgi:hypothetical protein